jgi:hypothetical protein
MSLKVYLATTRLRSVHGLLAVSRNSPGQRHGGGLVAACVHNGLVCLVLSF